jgi:hypothetical protein
MFRIVTNAGEADSRAEPAAMSAENLRATSMLISGLERSDSNEDRGWIRT